MRLRRRAWESRWLTGKATWVFIKQLLLVVATVASRCGDGRSAVGAHPPGFYRGCVKLGTGVYPNPFLKLERLPPALGHALLVSVKASMPPRRL